MFIKLIKSVMDMGKTAVMLVPEISLTTQMLGKFKSLFGDKIAVMHSSLSLGQRTDEFKRVMRGEARIVIGTRSAIFAPVTNVGKSSWTRRASRHISRTQRLDTMHEMLPYSGADIITACC